MPLKEIEVDETPHNMDGLLLHGWDGSEEGGGIHKQAGHGELDRSAGALSKRAKARCAAAATSRCSRM